MYFVNNLPDDSQRFIGLEATLEERYVTDYLFKVLSVDFELDWHTVKSTGEFNVASGRKKHLQIPRVVTDLFILVAVSSVNAFGGTSCSNGHNKIKVDVGVRGTTQPPGLIFYFRNLLGG